jgi:hypothetical protein
MYAGPWKTGSTIALSPGAAMKPYGASEIEMGWVQSWEQLVGFVLSVFGVSKSLAFMTEDTSYAILYAALKQFNLFSMMPLLETLADADNQQGIWPFWGDDYWIEYEPRPIDDEELRERQIQTDLQAGIRTINEIRSLRKLTLIDKPWGNERAINGARFAPDPNQEQATEQDQEAKPGRPTQPGEAPPHSDADQQLQSLLEGTAGNGQPNRMRQAGEMERSRPMAPGNHAPPVPGQKSYLPRIQPSYRGHFSSGRLNGVTTNGFHV